MTITFTTETTTTVEQRILGSGPGLPPALPNYPAQSATTIDGSPAALFGLPFMVIASVFALIGLIAWVRWAQMLGDLLRYGNSFLAYDEFPYFLGGTLRARLRAPRHLAAVNSLSFTLRCVQERYVTTGAGNNRSEERRVGKECRSRWS